MERLRAGVSADLKFIIVIDSQRIYLFKPIGGYWKFTNKRKVKLIIPNHAGPFFEYQVLEGCPIPEIYYQNRVRIYMEGLKWMIEKGVKEKEG